jgi:hypothetical protein
MPGWFWVLLALCGLSGIAMFGLSYRRADEAGGPAKLTPRARMIGFVGLMLISWSVLLGIIGGIAAAMKALS